MSTEAKTGRDVDAVVALLNWIHRQERFASVGYLSVTSDYLFRCLTDVADEMMVPRWFRNGSTLLNALWRCKADVERRGYVILNIRHDSVQIRKARP